VLGLQCCRHQPGDGPAYYIDCGGLSGDAFQGFEEVLKKHLAVVSQFESNAASPLARPVIR
jgi:hypothetical protein